MHLHLFYTKWKKIICEKVFFNTQIKINVLTFLVFSIYTLTQTQIHCYSTIIFFYSRVEFDYKKYYSRVPLKALIGTSFGIIIVVENDINQIKRNTFINGAKQLNNYKTVWLEENNKNLT